jgi:hypothetical protein
MTVMISKRIGVEMRLKIERTVYTRAEFKLYCPYSAEYTPKMMIDAKIGSIFMITSI